MKLRIPILFILIFLVTLTTPSTLSAQTEPPPIPVHNDPVPLPDEDPPKNSGATVRFLAPPGNFRATTAGTIVNLNWNAVSGASYYWVRYSHRSFSGWRSLPSTYGTSASHSGLIRGETYDYTVCTINAFRLCVIGSSSPAISVTIPRLPTATPRPPTATPRPRPQHLVPRPHRNTSSPDRNTSSPDRNTSSPDRNTSSPDRNTSSPTAPQHLVPRPQHLVPRPQHLVPRPQHLVPRPQHLVPRPQHLPPTATPRPPTATPRPPIATPRPPTATPSPLAVPVVTAHASANQVVVSWKRISGANQYDAWWWANRGDGWQRLALDTTETSVIHRGVTAGTTYWYSVRAENAHGARSDWSTNVSVTVPSPTNTPTAISTPRAPSLSIRLDLLTQNSLSWTGIGVPVSYYSIERNIPSESSGWSEIGTSVVTSYTDTDVDTGQTYQYRVRAMASINNPIGDWSNWFTRTLPASTPRPMPVPPTPTSTPTPPAKPHSVGEHVGCFGSELTCFPFLWPWEETWVTWVSNLVLSADFQNYGHFDVHISKMTGSTAEYQRTDSAGPYLYYKNDQVEPGETYRYKVRAVRRMGSNQDLYSDWTEDVEITVPLRPSVVRYPYADRLRLWPDIEGAQTRCIEYQLVLNQNCLVEAPNESRGAEEEPTPSPKAKSSPTPTATSSEESAASPTATATPTSLEENQRQRQQRQRLRRTNANANSDSDSEPQRLRLRWSQQRQRLRRTPTPAATATPTSLEEEPTPTPAATATPTSLEEGQRQQRQRLRLRWRKNQRQRQQRQRLRLRWRKNQRQRQQRQRLRLRWRKNQRQRQQRQRLRLRWRKNQRQRQPSSTMKATDKL